MTQRPAPPGGALPPTIGEAEYQAWLATQAQLQDVSRLVDAALTLTSRSVEAAVEQPYAGQSLAARVGALLIVRIMNDLRAALHDARIGYPVQSVALVTGLYEMRLQWPSSVLTRRGRNHGLRTLTTPGRHGPSVRWRNPWRRVPDVMAIGSTSDIGFCVW
jgi:hypothetical protein